MSASAEKNWRRFLARKRALGLKRIQLWVREEDVEALQEAARQPEALARLREEVKAELRAELQEALGARLGRRANEAARASDEAWLDELKRFVGEPKDTKRGSAK